MNVELVTEKGMNIGQGISGATFNDDRSQRFGLWRVWKPNAKSLLLFIGLNPSTANETRDAPTVRRMINFAKSWGREGLFVGNLFSQVTPYPAALVKDPGGDPTQEAYFALNDVALRIMARMSDTVVVGWGDFGKRFPTRVAEVLKLIGGPVHCIKLNQSGEPCHPLYLRSDSQLIRYYRKGVGA